MIQLRSMLQVADNTGAKIAQCIKVLGGSRKRYAKLGDVIVVAIKEAAPRGTVKAHAVERAVIVRMKKESKRKDGSYIRFDENAVVIVEKEKKEPIAGRIFGPIPREVGEAGFKSIVSKASEVV